MAITSVPRELLLNWMFGGTGTPPASYWVALYTTLPAAAGTGGVEVAGNGYARAEVVNIRSNWPAAKSDTTETSTISNGIVVPFPTPTADWGTVVGAGLHNVATGGVPWHFNALLTSFEVKVNANVSLPIGAIRIPLKALAA